MSLHSYQQSRKVNSLTDDFEAILMAAMRKADTDNSFKFRSAWPELWGELQVRYNMPAGMLPGEVDHCPEGDYALCHACAMSDPGEVVVIFRATGTTDWRHAGRGETDDRGHIAHPRATV